MDPLSELKRPAESKGSELGPTRRLYDLYDDVLESMPYSSWIDQRMMRRILAIVLVTSSTTPLPASAITIFLRKSQEIEVPKDETVGKIVRSLASVIWEDDENEFVVRAYHPSFLDYLAEKMKLAGWERLTQVHELLFNGSMTIMFQQLRFNICGLEDASLLNKDITSFEDLVLQRISSELRYACVHWFTHLEDSELFATDEKVQEDITRLLCHIKVLFWLEVLSIMNAPDVA